MGGGLIGDGESSSKAPNFRRGRAGGVPGTAVRVGAGETGVLPAFPDGVRRGFSTEVLRFWLCKRPPSRLLEGLQCSSLL